MFGDLSEFARLIVGIAGLGLAAIVVLAWTLAIIIIFKLPGWMDRQERQAEQAVDHLNAIRLMIAAMVARTEDASPATDDELARYVPPADPDADEFKQWRQGR
jgi:hypothetical protein